MPPQRHFLPLRLRSRFSPERCSGPSQTSTRRIIFVSSRQSTEVDVNPTDLQTSVEPDPEQATPPTLSQPSNTLPSLIQKPTGEVSQLKKGGYNLFQTLGWSEETYRIVQVSSRKYYSGRNREIIDLSVGLY